MDLLLIRYGNLVALSPDGQSACPGYIEDLLSRHLQYVLREFKYGADAIDRSTGRSNRVTLTTKLLFYRDSLGRLCTGFGFTKRISELLAKAGHRMFYQDVSPPRKRPRCFEQHPENVRGVIEYRPRQEECIDLMSRCECGLINAAPGFGKTTLIVAMALRFPYARIDVVVKPVDVARKIRRSLTKQLPGVGLVGDGECMTGRVTIYTADSLHKSDGEADFLIADEAHQLLAPSYADEISRRYQFSRNFALTATPEGRSDGADVKMEFLFGPEIFYLPYPEAVRLGLVVPIYVQWKPVRMLHNPAKGAVQPTTKKRWGIWRNEERNKIIAAAAHEIPDDVQTLVLVETVEHAVYLWQHMPEYRLCYGQSDTNSLAGYRKQRLIPRDFPDVTAQLRDKMTNDFEAGTLKKVIATDVWSTGVDFPELSELIRADERDSVITSTQGPARVSRLHIPSGKPAGRITDFADFFDDNLKKKSLARRRIYKGLEWEQQWPEDNSQIESA